MTHKTPLPNVTIPGQRFMWLEMYTRNCDVCVCFRSSCGCLFVFGLCDPGHWQTAEAGGRPCAVAMRDIWFCELWFTASSAGSGPAHVFVMRQVSAQFSQGVSVYYFSLIAHDIYSLCEMLSFYDAIVQVSVNLEVGSDCCWLLHIDNQTHRIVYSTYIEPQQFWPRISNCQKYTIDPTMP